MKILITGSSGFVGNFLAKYFSAQGISVVGFDLHQLSFQDYANFTFINGDVRDKEKINNILQTEEITHVIHLAYLMKPQHDRNFEHAVDVDGSKNIFDAANSSKTVKQFIHFSSASIYGGRRDNPLWLKEDSFLHPGKWVYAQNKKEIEEYYFKNKRADLKLINFRMCTAAGPSYFRHDGIVDILVKSPFGVLLDGRDTLVQFIHENDVKNLVELVINDPKIEGIFNLAPDSYAATKELAPKPKLFISFPKFLFKLIISALWYLRLSPVSPTSVDLVAHSIVISPEKLMKRYNYKFRYSTKETFFDEYNSRKQKGTI